MWATPGTGMDAAVMLMTFVVFFSNGETVTASNSVMAGIVEEQ